MRRLLLAAKAQALLPALEKEYDVRVCFDGAELSQELLAFRPELMVLDLALPNCDPEGLLRIAQALDIRPLVLGVAIGMTGTLTQMLEEGILNYLLFKPLDEETVCKRLRQMCLQLNDINPQRLSTIAGGILQELGLHCSQSGFQYLIEGALYLFDNAGCKFGDELYPYIAKRCNSTKEAVDKAMSRSIGNAWKHRNEHVWRYYFPEADRRPVNTAFLKGLVQAMKKAL